MLERMQLIARRLILGQEAGPDRRPAAAVGYGLLVALISVAIVMVVTSLATEFQGVFQAAADRFL